MDRLEFEEKLKIKHIIEKTIYFTEKDRKKFNLLKGSLESEKIKILEDLLEKEKYYYEEGTKEKEAKCFCIGKALLVLERDERTIIEIISLEDFNFGIDEYRRITGEFFREHMKKALKIRENLEGLVNKFLTLGKLNRIEKGRILEKIDEILTDNKALGKKSDMWMNRLGISSSDKSMLCKRYNLFLEFKDNELFMEEKNYIKVIEDMTDAKLKEITKEELTLQEKEEILVSLIK